MEVDGEVFKKLQSRALLLFGAKGYTCGGVLLKIGGLQ